METVLFVCERYPELNLVLDSKDILSDPKSGRTRAHSGKEVHFKKIGRLDERTDRVLFRGELETTDQEVADFVRGHEWFGRHIKEEAYQKGRPEAPHPDRVNAGLMDSGKKEPEYPAPKEDSPAPGKAKVSKALKKKLVAA